MYAKNLTTVTGNITPYMAAAIFYLIVTLRSSRWSAPSANIARSERGGGPQAQAAHGVRCREHRRCGHDEPTEPGSADVLAGAGRPVPSALRSLEVSPMCARRSPRDQGRGARHPRRRECASIARTADGDLTYHEFAEASTPSCASNTSTSRLDQTRVLRDVNLDVWPGEVVVVLGPSGSGKSTMLRCINLLDTHRGTHPHRDQRSRERATPTPTGFGETWAWCSRASQPLPASHGQAERDDRPDEGAQEVQGRG